MGRIAVKVMLSFTLKDANMTKGGPTPAKHIYCLCLWTPAQQGTMADRRDFWESNREGSQAEKVELGTVYLCKKKGYLNKLGSLS